MKKFFALTLFVALLAIPASAQDDDMKFSLGAKAGWFLYQDEPMSEVLDNNWTVAGELILWINDSFGIGAEIEYYTDDEEMVSVAGADIMMELDQIPLNLNAYYRMSNDSKITPYIGAGASMIMTDIMATATIGATTVDLEYDEMDFGFSIFAGAQYENFFVEAQYLWAETDLDLALPGDTFESVSLSGFSFWAGVRF